MSTTASVAAIYGLPKPSEKALEAANRIADDFSPGFYTDFMVIKTALHIDDVYKESE